MRTCKFCKHGYGYCQKNSIVVHCYLRVLGMPVVKDVDDTCDDWKPDYDEDEDDD